MACIYEQDVVSWDDQNIAPGLHRIRRTLRQPRESSENSLGIPNDEEYIYILTG